MKTYCAIDIGGTFVKFGMVDEKGSISERGKIKTPDTLEGLLDLIEKYAASYPDAEGIAISSPGAVSEEGIIYGSSAITYLHGPNIKEKIEIQTGRKVFMENDANCAGYAEMWLGEGKDKQDVLVMVIGSGIGGSVFKNRELHKGTHLHGGEFGYMLLTSEITDSNDVWSRVASTKALVRKTARLKGMSPEELSGEKIFHLAEEGDAVCWQTVNEFYHLLAIGIYNLQYIYDPEVILIGGGISARDDLISHIDRKLDDILQKIDLAKIKPAIASCAYRQDANLLGCVYGFQTKYD